MKVAQERFVPCPWCIRRGHIVVECQMCEGRGWVPGVVEEKSK